MKNFEPLQSDSPTRTVHICLCLALLWGKQELSRRLTEIEVPLSDLLVCNCDSCFGAEITRVPIQEKIMSNLMQLGKGPPGELPGSVSLVLTLGIAG